MPQIFQERPVHRETLIVDDDARRPPRDLQRTRLVETIGGLEVHPDGGARDPDHT